MSAHLKNNVYNMYQQLKRTTDVAKRRKLLIAIRVIEHLCARDLTLKEFAALLKVSTAYATQVASGKINFTIYWITKLEKTLGIQLIEIL